MNKYFHFSIETYGNFYLGTFAKSFDNFLTPFYAPLICLWGENTFLENL